LESTGKNMCVGVGSGKQSASALNGTATCEYVDYVEMLYDLCDEQRDLIPIADLDSTLVDISLSEFFDFFSIAEYKGWRPDRIDVIGLELCYG